MRISSDGVLIIKRMHDHPLLAFMLFLLFVDLTLSSVLIAVFGIESFRHQIQSLFQFVGVCAPNT